MEAIVQKTPRAACAYYIYAKIWFILRKKYTIFTQKIYIILTQKYCTRIACYLSPRLTRVHDVYILPIQMSTCCNLHIVAPVATVSSSSKRSSSRPRTRRAISPSLQSTWARTSARRSIGSPPRSCRGACLTFTALRLHLSSAATISDPN